jgi:pyruvate dehydrogenase E2 component (dihydrolipoamide acetyltransferase)
VDGKVLELSRMRTAVGRRMVESKQQVPHFYVQTEIDVAPMSAAIAALKVLAPGVRITMTLPLVRACVAALREHPRFNSVWTADGLLQVSEVNLGLAIALDDGLLAPALLGVDELGVVETAAALADLAERARSSRLRPRELSDGTFTLSNLGMFDVSAFTAIVTPPQVAILAAARPVERLTARGSAALMTATLSADHRAVDGADAARFLQTFKNAFQDPESLLPEPTDVKEAMS